MSNEVIVQGHYANHTFIPDGPLPDAEGKAELIIMPHQPADPWRRWFDKLRSFRALKDGWNGYTAKAPNQSALDNTHLFLQVMQLEGVEPTRVAPSAMGGIAVTRQVGKRKVFIELYNDGRAYSLFSEKAGEMDVVPLQANSISFRGLIANMRDYLNVECAA